MMPIASIYDVFFNGEKWVARLGEEILDRSQLLAKIKSRRKADIAVEEEWAALALIERYATEARWEASGIK